MSLVVMCSVRMTQWGRKSAVSSFLIPGFSHPSFHPLQCPRDGVVSLNTLSCGSLPPWGKEEGSATGLLTLSPHFLVLKNCRVYGRRRKGKSQSSQCFWHFPQINHYWLNEWVNKWLSRFYFKKELNYLSSIIKQLYIFWLSTYTPSKECIM